MKLGFVCACVAMGGLGAVQAATYSDVSVDVSALPKERHFVRDLVLSRIRARTPPSERATLKVRFDLDRSLSGEKAVVTVANGEAAVRGGRFRSLIFGAGVLLRTIRYGERSFELADGTYPFAPESAIRIAYFARHFDNWYLKAGADELRRYVDELALWGINGFMMQLDYPSVDMVWSTEGDRAVFAATSVALGERVHALDMDLMTFGGFNCAPEDMPAEYRATPDAKPRGITRYNVCPEKPGARDYLLGIWREKWNRMRHLPVSSLIYWPFDEGGCACEKCAPWGGNGYVRLIEQMAGMNGKIFPGAKQIVSTWLFREDDWKTFYAYLERQDWIDAILVDGHTDKFPEYPLEHPVPKDIPVITFPEISMWGRFPWGGTGANPLPGRFRMMYRQSEKIAKGFMLYSEGIFEDLNKIFVNAIYMDPKRPTDDILAEYARWEMPGCDPSDFAALCHKLEDIYVTKHGKSSGRTGHRFSKYVAGTEEMPAPAELERRTAVAREAAALADKIDSAILPRMRRAWRWRQLYLRAKIDAEAYAARDARTAASLAAYAELEEIYHAQRQVERLYDGTWRGYTCPPYIDSDRMRRRAE